MKPTCWMKQIGLCLVAGTMLAGVAWADPEGTANVSQIVNAQTFRGASEQRTFRTTDGNVNFFATYYDTDNECAGVNPVIIQLRVFNSEGLSVRNADLSGILGPAPASHNTSLNVGLDAGTFDGPGTYSYTWLVRNCTNTRSVVLTPFGTFRLVAP